jgi:hypothetical protein
MYDRPFQDAVFAFVQAEATFRLADQALQFRVWRQEPEGPAAATLAAAREARWAALSKLQALATEADLARGRPCVCRRPQLREPSRN